MTDHLIAKVQEHVPNIPLKIISQGAEALVLKHQFTRTTTTIRVKNTMSHLLYTIIQHLLSNIVLQNLIVTLK